MSVSPVNGPVAPVEPIGDTATSGKAAKAKKPVVRGSFRDVWWRHALALLALAFALFPIVFLMSAAERRSMGYDSLPSSLHDAIQRLVGRSGV